LNANSKLDA